MSLKHWIVPKDHFKTHLFFSIFGWGDPSQLGSWSEGCVKPLKLSREAIWQVSEDPYHTEFVSWQVDHFSFFFISFPLGGGAHWALDPREVILKSQIWKIWKLAKSYNVWCLTTLMMVVILFQTSFAHIWEIYYRNFEGFIKNALTRSIFELEKCSFFLNGSEFRQKLIGTIIRVLVRH